MLVEPSTNSVLSQAKVCGVVWCGVVWCGVELTRFRLASNHVIACCAATNCSCVSPGSVKGSLARCAWMSSNGLTSQSLAEAEAFQIVCVLLSRCVVPRGTTGVLGGGGGGWLCAT